MFITHTSHVCLARLPQRAVFAFAGVLGASFLLAGCAPMPVGPTVAVMPAANKPFEVFMQEDQLCRGWAAHAIGQPGNDAAARQLLASGATGAVIGALAGATLGDHRSAGAGAAMGAVVGSSIGANQGAASAWTAQRQYDISYQQCMYSKGNVVPSAPYGTYRRAVPMPPPPGYR